MLKIGGYAARILQDQLGMFINFEDQKRLFNKQNLNLNLIKTYYAVLMN